MVSFKTMHHLLQEKVAFLKYDSMIQLLSHFNVTTNMKDRRGNANLMSERFKMEIIDILGMLISDRHGYNRFISHLQQHTVFFIWDR